MLNLKAAFRALEIERKRDLAWGEGHQKRKAAVLEREELDRQRLAERRLELAAERERRAGVFEQREVRRLARVAKRSKSAKE